MDKCSLAMKWDYTYDKESAWLDRDKGEKRYEWISGAQYPLRSAEDNLKHA